MKKERKRILRLLLLVGAIVCLIVIGVRLLADRRYTLISMTIAFLSCFSFYHAYEKKEGGIRRMVMIAVMTTIAVLGRLIFGPIPGFKPVSAIVILTGMFMGAESGFLVGSLTAVISNIFFGQGPWTPFQMLTLGTIGMLSGLPGLRDLLKKRGPLVVWGILMGFLYSGIMDIWSVLDFAGTWTLEKYILALINAIPYILAYMTSNVVFLMLTLKPIGAKLERIQKKHGIF